MANSVKDPVTGLTSRQEEFCRYVIEKHSLTAAYRAAYDIAPTTKDSTVHNKAYALHCKAEVQARIKALRDEKRQGEQWTKERLQDFIRDQAMSIAVNAARESDRVAALRLLGETAQADAFAARKIDQTVKRMSPGDAKERLQKAIERALAEDSNVVAIPQRSK